MYRAVLENEGCGCWEEVEVVSLVFFDSYMCVMPRSSLGQLAWIRSCHLCNIPCLLFFCFFPPIPQLYPDVANS